MGGFETTGSCLCGAVQVHVKGDPVEVLLCYCSDCRKISGSTNSLNWAINSHQISIDTRADISLSSVTVAADSGGAMIGFFCPGCGTTLYRQSSAVRGMAFVKAGIFDDAVVNKRQPRAEIYVKRRPQWMCALAGVEQKKDG